MLCGGGFTHIAAHGEAGILNGDSNPDPRLDLPDRDHVEVGERPLARQTIRRIVAAALGRIDPRFSGTIGRRPAPGLVNRVRIQPAGFSAEGVASMQRRRARFTPGSLHATGAWR